MESMTFRRVITSYQSTLVLLLALASGIVVGWWVGPAIVVIKPLGDLFLTAMYVLVIPLLFFSIASALANQGRLIWGQLIKALWLFLRMSLIASLFMLVVLVGVPLSKLPQLANPQQLHAISTPTLLPGLSFLQHISLFWVMGAGIALGLVAAYATDQRITKNLNTLTAGLLKAVNVIMCYAPLGFFAYFALLTASLGPLFFSAYLQVTLTYYITALIYGFLIFSLYALFVNRFKAFWKAAFLPAFTALATCSSAATLPVNLQAAERLGIRAEVFEMVLPLGTMVHKQGSILGGVLKIAFLFTVYGLNFYSLPVLGLTLILAILVGTVMGAIPSGGMTGEMLILAAFGFPPSALILIAVISLLIDPPATVLNALGNLIASLMLDRNPAA